jgi:PAS domain S-box-containing protein
MAGKNRERLDVEPPTVEVWLAAVLEESAEPLLLVDGTGRLTRVSRSARRLVQDVCGRALADGDALGTALSVDPDVPGVPAPLARALAGNVASGACTLIDRAGATRRFELRCSPAVDSIGVVRGALVRMLDPSATRASDARLGDGVDEVYRTIADRSFHGLILLTPSRLVYVNEASARIFGYEVGEILGFSVAQLMGLIHPDDRERVQKRFADRFAGLPVADTTEFRAIRSDGAIRWIEGHAREVVHRGEPAVQIEQIDITERREAIRALHESEALNRQLVAQAPVGIVATDAAGNPTMVNPAALEILGSPSAESTKALNVFHLPTLQGAGLARSFQVAASTRALQRVEGRYRSVWGKESDVSLSVSPLLDDSGDLAGMLAIIEDVTERRRAEAARSALLELARDLSASLDTAVIASLAQRRARELLPTADIAMLAVDLPEDARANQADSQEQEDARRVGALLAEHLANSDAAMRTLMSGASLVAADATQQPWVDRHTLATLGVGPLLVAPLLGRTFLGLAAWRNEKDRPFSPMEIDLLEGIARQVAFALGRAKLHAAQQDEARIAGALARVGQELISKLNDPSLLDELCRVTAEVLGCDRSMTVLLDSDTRAYSVVACFGETSERWELIRQMRIPAGFDHELRERIWREHVAVVTANDGSRLGALAQEQGISQALYLGLRRGDELIGFQTADVRQVRRFDASQERIARGIAQLASLALEDARLVSQLERASRLKSEFVATMSHELRTPLHIILGYLDLVLDGAFGDLRSEQRDSLQRADRSARALLELINATLDMSRLEAGDLSLDLSEVAIADLIAEVDADTRELRTQSGLEFSRTACGELPSVYTDRGKLKTVLRNLVVNAIKYTRAGSVAIEARSRSAGIEISVRDTGIGIPPEMLQEIFEPFRQLDGSTRASRGGVGLGLYIVRRLLDELGGTVEVQSTVGEGTTFRVWLPIVARPSADRQAERAPT